MTLNDLAQGEDWMYPEERRIVAAIVRSLRQTFADRQIPEGTFLLLRVQDYLTHHTLCRRLDRGLMPNPPQESNPPFPPSTAPSAPPDLKLVEQIGKSRDRLRRTLKELEDATDKLDPSVPSSKAPSEGKVPAKGGAPEEVQPHDPMHNPKYIQDLIKEVGIDLNDPDFFADVDNFYDVPPYTRPTNPGPVTPAPHVTPAQAGAQSSSPPPSPPESSSNSEPHSSHESHWSHMSHDCHYSQPPDAFTDQNPLPPDPRPQPQDPKRSPIPPTPPPKVFVYKVKPTPFNQSPRFKKHECYDADR
jgi:hypothetical protein